MKRIQAGFDNKGWLIVAVLFVIIFLGIAFRWYVSEDDVSEISLSPEEENERIILTIIVGIVFLIMVIGLIWVTRKRS